MTDEIILNYLRDKVKGAGSSVWKDRICRELQMPAHEVEEAFEILVDAGYLKKEWVFIDDDDEEHVLSAEIAAEAYESGKLYHPDTLELITDKIDHYLKPHYQATKKLASEGSFRSAGWFSENVYVMRVDDIERTKTFFESFGLRFQKERHGRGPEHYACEQNGKVLEIYRS